MKKITLGAFGLAVCFAASVGQAQSALDPFAQQERDENEEAAADSAWQEGRKVEAEAKEAAEAELERDFPRWKVRTPTPLPTATRVMDPSYSEMEREIDQLDQ